MPAERLLDDVTVEAVLRGDPVPPELEAVADAVQSLRMFGEAPVRPTRELSERIAAGEFAGAAAPLPSRRSTGLPVPGRHRGRRRNPLAGLAAMSGRARVATGLAVALTGLTGVTAAGALPGPAQQHVESVIEMITPIEFPPHADFGQETAEDARDGGVDGEEVSDRAKDQGQQPTSDTHPSDSARDDLPEPAQQAPGSPDRGDAPKGHEMRPTDPPDDVPSRPEDRSHGARDSSGSPSGSAVPGPDQ